MGVRVLPQHLTITGALALALCLVALLGIAGSRQAYALEEVYKTGQVIVRLNPLIGATIEEINADYGTTTLDDTLGNKGIYLLTKPDNSETEETFAQNLANDPHDRVLYAEPNFVAEAPEDPAGVARHRPYGKSDRRGSSDAYAAENLHLSCAATDTNRGEGTTVAILDTGAQLDHRALQGNFRGVKRYDFVDNDTKPFDRLDADGDGLKDQLAGHGTHVAGIVDRVAPAAKIMPLRVLNSAGSGDVFTIAKAISFAQRNGADVINLSLGTSRRSDLLQDMVRDATGNDIVVAAAAGNSNSEAKHYPAAADGPAPSVEGLLAVTSVDMNEKKSDFANYGLWVDIAAPGEGIRSTFPIDKYANWTGTSMATPFISGQAALIHAVNPSRTSAGIENKIRSSARSIEFPKNDATLIGKLGAGHADVCASL
jgi:thermitase